MTTSSFIKASVVGAMALGAQLAIASTGLTGNVLSLNATCSCRSAGDCTCKKGSCKCAKCGNHHTAKVIESLKQTPSDTRLPQTARLEATGGVRI